MVTFQWRGTDPRGREQRGECAAGGLVEAAARLRAQGLAPISVERLDPEPSAQFSVTADAFTTFNRNLAEMTSVGLPLARAVREISAGLRGGRFKEALRRVEAELREGRPLDEAVAKVPGAFPPYYGWMLKAGAASGNLPAVLSAVARNSEGIRYARRAFLEALAYPLLVFLGALALVICSVLFYVPLAQELCRMNNVQPSLTVQMLIGVFSSTRTLAALGIGAAVLGMLVAIVLRRTVAGERFVRRIPIVGRIHTYLSAARLLGALGVMLRTNTPLPDLLPVAIGASGTLEQIRDSERLAALAAEGRGLGAVLAEVPGLPENVAGYLALAERTGNAGETAGELARLLTEQAAAESEYLFMVLMPAALLAAGVFVASILIPVVASYIQLLENLHP